METTHRHQKIPELRHHDIQRHELPGRPSEQRRWVRPSELQRAAREAEKDERERFGQAVVVLGLAYLGELLDTIKKPASNPAPTPLKSDETIIDAEFEDIEDTETKELVIKS